jgi:serine acetyltransferase
VKVGAWATIAAGSVATRHVPAGAVVIGVPGKVALTPNVRFRMGEFSCLPQALQSELESQFRLAAA